MIAHLRNQPAVNVIFLQNRPRVSQRFGFNLSGSAQSRLRLKTIHHRGFFGAVSLLERLVLFVSGKIARVQADDLVDVLELGDAHVCLCPTSSSNGLFLSYPPKEINKLVDLDLDLLIRGNAHGIFRGKILNVAKDGFISFHHGDNRWNRGGPPGFWEVYLRKPSTGFIIQKLSEELDNGLVLLRGDFLTKPTFTENQRHLFDESFPHLTTLLDRYIDDGGLKPIEPPQANPPAILKTPTINQTLKYLIFTLTYFANGFWRRYVMGKHQVWAVGFCPCPDGKIDYSQTSVIENPPSRFFADPFIVERGNRTICFVEDYSFKLKRARISAIEILGCRQYEVLGPVLEESFHLSFPSFFEFKSNLYMVPESRASSAIRLYRCTDFPMKWEYQSDLLRDQNAVDTIIFEHGERWWLLTTLESNQGDQWSTLYAYYSEDPTSRHWKPHQRNPIVIDSNIARNGGFFRTPEGVLERVRQEHGFNLYGKALTTARITRLTPDSFNERLTSRIDADILSDAIGCHHLHRNNDFAVFDFLRFVRP